MGYNVPTKDIVTVNVYICAIWNYVLDASNDTLCQHYISCFFSLVYSIPPVQLDLIVSLGDLICINSLDHYLALDI